MICVGLDVGSRSMELVAVEEGQVVAQRRGETAFDYPEQARRLLEGLGHQRLMATGYGRHRLAQELGVPQVTEIKAHAVGVRQVFPQAAMVLDIGGQDTKAMALGPKGQVLRFQMNDRCAAGTGKFLEVMAQALGVPLAGMGELALAGQAGLVISSMCTVFAETEVVALRARGARPADVARALCDSVARRAAAMLQRVGLEGPLVFTGGVARNQGVVAQLGDILGRQVLVPPEPEFTGALGAAILAGELGPAPGGQPA